MARPKKTKPKTAADAPVTDYRHTKAKRKNIPPVGLAAQGKIAEKPAERYFYNPHLPPILRFDVTGKADRLPELLEKTRQRALTGDEVAALADALRNQEPWLEWTGKREKKAFEVDPVALHIHERVSAQAILRMAARQDATRDLFADPEQEYREAVQFYQHDVDWSNRLILGDSLVVMHSLAKREDLAGKIQMIYMDPPYGIKFASNFQPKVGQPKVKDKSEDLTREPEMVKAYRDTWTLGVHSYLSYLRDRLIAARELLSDGGSIFVQIGDENLHKVRSLMDEVFGPSNFISIISYQTSIGLGGSMLDSVCNYLIWFARNKEAAEKRYRQIFKALSLGYEGATRYTRAESQITGEQRLLNEKEQEEPFLIAEDLRPFTDQGLTSRTGSDTTTFRVQFQSKEYTPTVGGWRTGPEGMNRVLGAERVLKAGETIRFKKFFTDFGAIALTNFWSDVGGGIQSRSDPKVYVTQTATKIIERCILMTTDPGDLVLDPTCGSGTTAYVAEQWGRRWITIDTSRVALAIARQRLLTAKFDYYKLRPITAKEKTRNTQGPWIADTHNRISGPCAFHYKTIPHIELKTIARNVVLDSIFAKHEPIMAEKLKTLNAALKEVTPTLRSQLLAKLETKRKRKDKTDPVTEADERRWRLPDKKWDEWEVPFDTDQDWPKSLQAALTAYRAAWRAKMDEVNTCIEASAEQEELVDQPEVDRSILRVSGPFTVEAVQPAEETLDMESPIGGEPEPLETFAGVGAAAEEPANAEAYLDKMIRLLRGDGIRFPNNKEMKFARLDPLAGDVLHAEGEWANGNGKKARRVAVVFGPQYGPVTAKQVEDCLRSAHRRGYDELVFAGFTFDGAAQAAVQENQDDKDSKVRAHIAHIRPDVNMGGLLKDTPSSQLFTVFGLPRTTLKKSGDGEWVVEMEGVDIYNPVENTIMAADASKVAAWFLDTDYDGRTFCICQAFFPDADAWEKLAKALQDVVDPERFAALSGTTSLPFPAGKHKRAAVKVIDPRGNEVMQVHPLGKAQYQ